MKFDNFMLSMHQTCPAKYDLRIRHEWQIRRKSPALGFGSAFHSGLAEWYRGNGIAAAINAIESVWSDAIPTDDHRTLEKCKRTFIEYCQAYPHENWLVIGGPDSPLVETPFTVETGMFLPCDDLTCIGSQNIAPGSEAATRDKCGVCRADREPIEYGGILDLGVDFSGMVYVVDHKTTSMMGPLYFNQFKPNNQMTGYIWGCAQLSGKRVAGAIINAVCITRGGKVDFKRNITTRTQTDIDTWLRDVYAEACDIRYHERTGHWPMRTNACMQYGMCEFHSVHVLSHPREQLAILEQDYIKDRWDYENRAD